MQMNHYILLYLQQRLEDLRAENLRLASQLESSLSEARRQADLQREKTTAKVPCSARPGHVLYLIVD